MTISLQFNSVLNWLQVEGSCFLSGTKAGEPIADGILAAASKLDVDILVMGIAGYGQASCHSCWATYSAFRGSFAKQLVYFRLCALQVRVDAELIVLQVCQAWFCQR